LACLSKHTVASATLYPFSKKLYVENLSQIISMLAMPKKTQTRIAAKQPPMD
jgi:hypothetical protein